MSKQSYFQHSEECGCEKKLSNERLVCYFSCLEGRDSIGWCTCDVDSPASESCKTDIKKVLDFADFEKYDKSIAGFDQIYKCVNHKTDKTNILCGIFETPSAKNRLNMTCVSYAFPLNWSNTEISVPKSFLLKYKSEEVTRNTLIAIFLVLTICIIGSIGLFICCKFAKKKSGEFSKKRRSQKHAKSVTTKRLSEFSRQRGVDETEQETEGVDNL